MGEAQSFSVSLYKADYFSKAPSPICARTISISIMLLYE